MPGSTDHRERIHVLVVEDDFLVAREIVRCLRECGYTRISEAPDGSAAVDAACESHPDVVVMDLEMPVMGGVEATRRIQERCPTPVVVLTAYESELDQATAAGASAYLTKPPNPGTLDRAITVALARHADLMEARAEAERLQKEAREATGRAPSLDEALLGTLEGLLPMCARCKAVRDEHGSWKAVEIYIRDHSRARVTHGICTSCAHELYPEVFADSS